MKSYNYSKKKKKSSSSYSGYNSYNYNSKNKKKSYYDFDLDDDDDERRCPYCGEKLVLRHRRSDGHPFYGCPNYPACDYTENV